MEGIGASSLKAQGDCKVVLEAANKTVTTATHTYSTMNIAGKDQTVEIIYLPGVIYSRINGKWSSVKMTAQEPARGRTGHHGMAAMPAPGPDRQRLMIGRLRYFAGFLAAAFIAFAASARFSAHRFFVAAMIAFLPAAESFRLGLGDASGGDGSAAFLEAAHLFRCASAIAFLPAALIFRRLRFGGSGVAAGSVGPPVRTAWSSPICESMCRFCSSNPRMAAVMISGVSFVDMSAFRTIHVNAFCGPRSRRGCLPGSIAQGWLSLCSPGKIFGC